MNHPSLSAQQIYDTAPLGSLIRFSDGTPEPPARHRRKHAAWESSNGTGRLTRKAPANRASVASFTLHLADFGSGGVTVVKAYRTVPVSSRLAYTVVETPRPGQAAILRDEGGTSTLLHLADTYAGAEAWLQAHSYRDARIVAADAPEPRTFTYLQDPGHGWLIVDRTDLTSAGMSAADFTVCSYVHGDTFALEEDVDMAKFLKRLDERGIAYRLREQHTNGDAHVRNWASNRSGPFNSARCLTMYGTYLRLDITVHAGWRAVVRAAAMKLKPEARRDPARREARHRFYRDMLEYHRGAQEIVSYWRL